MAADAEGTLRFHYMKSPSFLAIHADGAIGGPTPRGNIHVAFFAERPAIPTEITVEVRPDGQLGEERGRVGRDGIVREMSVDVVMDLETTKNVVEFLQKQISMLEEKRKVRATR